MSSFTFHYSWRWALRSDAASLWPYISDTDRFNEVTGFPAPIYTEEPLPEGGSRRLARLRQYGFPLAWDDAPFEWVREQEFVAERHCTTGPLAYTRNVVRLLPRPDGGTDLTYEITARPGNVLGYLGIPVQIGVLMHRAFARAFRRVDAYIQAQAAQPFATRRTPVRGAGTTRLQELAAQLVAAGHDAALVARLVEHIYSATDDQLSRMRPYAYADAWGADRRATLELFLRAARLGLLDVSWDMICPDCRGAKRQVASLREVSANNHCASCNIDYEVDFATSVEATFQLNPRIKAVMRADYCIGGPQNTPHILAQQVLAPGETRTLRLDLAAHRYRWRAPRLAGANPAPRTVTTLADPASGRVLLEVGPAGTAQAGSVTLREDGLTVSPEALHPGAATFTLHNASKREQILLLEQTDWSDQASTAAVVTSLQTFRDLFSSEALRPGEAISVESMTILFTDLKGSTALYRTIGDAPAFGRVMAHFDILREGVMRHQGAQIKTIGDAIMAVFTDPGAGMAAALDILAGFRAYNAAHPDQPLILKMGLHQGPCIAVTLNERLDYFGSVVNIAARLEGQSVGEDVVISEALASDPAVAQLLHAAEVRVAPFTANLKGFSEPFSLQRVTLAPAPMPVTMEPVLATV
jgi:class 3 adenylate cyclase